MQAAELMSEDSCKDVSDRIKNNVGGFDLVYIDTLNRNMGAGDENSTKDMTTFISNIDKYIRSHGCAVAIVHHTGLNNSDRARGSGALYNAIDSEFKVCKDTSGSIEITCTKQKEGISGWTKSLSLKPVIVGFDEEDNEDIYSCVLIDNEDSVMTTLKVREQSVFDALKHAIIEDGIDMKIDDEIDIVAVYEEAWKEEAYKRLDSKNLRRDFSIAKDFLIKNSYVFSEKKLFWLAA
jgi:hypothetical protein